MYTAPPQKTLAGQPVGRRVKFTGFALEPSVHQRLLEMGLTVGTEYLEPGYTASDGCAGNLTGSVTVSGTVNGNVVEDDIITEENN